MNLILDVKTIIIMLALGHLLSGILVIAYIIRNKSEKSINLFLTSRFLQLIAWTLIILRGNIHDLFSILLANYSLVIGATVEAFAFLSLIECYNSKAKRIYIGLILSFIFCFNIVYFWHNLESTRVMLFSIYVVILWIYPIYKLLATKGASALQRIFAILYGLGLLAFLSRALGVLKVGEGMTLMASNVFNALAFLSLYAVMLIGSIGFILLAKEKADHKLLLAATLDQMTGILNRASFIDNATELISYHRRKERSISMFMIDLDHFKVINDTYGHQIGDIVLKEFTHTIKKQLRDYDIFGRFGGEEFVVLLPETDQDIAVIIADRLRSSIEHSPVNIDNGISYTISIGVVSIVPSQETSVETLFNFSDKALYLAKERGRNRVELYIQPQVI